MDEVLEAEEVRVRIVEEVVADRMGCLDCLDEAGDPEGNEVFGDP